jgi:hypothetical protein
MVARQSWFDGFEWMHWIGGLYCVAVAIYSAGAYVYESLVIRAIICVGAQALGIVLAVLALRAMRAGGKVFGGFLCLPAVACCMVAALGIEHAWALQGGAPLPYVGALFIAAVELIVFLSVDHVADLQAAAKRRAADQAEADRQAKAISFTDTIARAEHQRAMERLAAETAAKSTAVRSSEPDGRRMKAAAAALAAGVASTVAPFEAAETAGRTAGSAEDLAVRLIQSGVKSRAELVRRVASDSNGAAKITAYRASQLLDLHAPGWSSARPAEPLAA